jgi:folate-binding protein YgfZ
VTTEPFWIADPRSFVQAEGPDALTYLQSQLSQDLSRLAAGGSTYSLVLEPAGKVIALVRVTRIGEESFVLDADPVVAEPLLARLTRFKIRVKADLTLLDWECIVVRGRDAAIAVGPGSDGSWVVPAWRGDGSAVDLIGPAPAAPDGVREGTHDDLLAARIEAAWPVAGVDYEIGAAIPAALGVSAEAVSFTKGCYPGQELVERMDSRGAQAPKTLRAFDVPAGTAAGDEIDVEGTTVRVTSVAGTRALALIHR